ncbi:unnamed protein product [Caenorhabditis brenneri]
MSEHDAEAYDKIWKKAQLQSKKKKEREWTKHQTSEDLDDGKLIGLVSGEQNIYRRRIDKEPDPGAPQTKPKRLRLCLDVSGSMYRFNGFQYCKSGDNTGGKFAVRCQRDCWLRHAMLKDPSINTFVIMIDSLGNQADMIQKELPAGKARTPRSCRKPWK